MVSIQDKEQFEQQLEDFLMCKELMCKELLKEIRSRGYWQIVVRPRKFLKERIPSLSDLKKLVKENNVSYRSWDFPHLTSDEVLYGPDYIGMATSFRGINETWRFYQSGLFVFFRGLTEDWVKNDRQPTHLFINPGEKLSIISALHRFSEVYEFVARLAQAKVFDNTLILHVNLVGTKGRELFFWNEDGMRLLRRSYKGTASELPKQESFNVTKFMDHSRDLSFKHFLWLMERFGFEASDNIFIKDQEKFFEECS